jgi:hypothetical protein
MPDKWSDACNIRGWRATSGVDQNTDAAKGSLDRGHTIVHNCQIGQVPFKGVDKGTSRPND